MSDVEDEAEMKEMTEEEIAKKNNWPRCSKCKRYMFMHEPGRGSNCKMEMMNDYMDGIIEEYELPDGMAPNDNGYGGEAELKCHMEEKVTYEDVCEPYKEEMC